MNARSLLEREALEPGNPGLPRLFDGRLELQKPPMYYWLVAGFGRLLGSVDGWAVRLPAALAALGCVVLLTWWGRRQGRPVEGLLSGLVLATAVHFTWLARIGRIDMPLTFAVAVSVLAFASQPERPRFRNQLVGYLGLALGVWLKGPIGILMPGAVLFLFFLVEGVLPWPWQVRRWGTFLHRVGAWWGVPLLVGLTVPWFVLADRFTDGEFQRVFLWHHNFERGVGGSRLRTHPWWLYIPLFSADFLPWTPFFVWSCFVVWKRGWRTLERPERLGLVWFVALFVSLSLSSYKRPDYLLPAYPGAALFVGWRLRRWLGVGEADSDTGSWHTKRDVRFAAVGCLLLASVVGWWVRVDWYLPSNEAGRDYTRLASIVREHAPKPERVLFFRTEAHALAFHVGRPMAILVQWEELREAIGERGRRYVVTSPDSLIEIRGRFPTARIEVLAENVELGGGWHERPLVFVKIEPGSTPST